MVYKKLRGNQASVNDPVKVDHIEFTSNELPRKNVDESPLLAKIQQKEKELQQLRGEEIDGLNTRLTKATTKLNKCQVKNSEMILSMEKLQEDLEKSKKELSYMRDKDKKMSIKLNEKVRELEEANGSADCEMMKLKQEIEQWRKAAKAMASVLVEGTEICSKTPELEPLVLYYSNRAAKRMSLGKIRKGFADRTKAAMLNPVSVKVCLKAGNRYLILGDIDNALHYYKVVLDSRMFCLDRRLIIEASDGLQKAEKVASYINKLAELLQHRTVESATTALEDIKEALWISPYSEKLLEMKGEALFMLHKYEEVIQMCEETLTSAEKYHVTVDDGNQMSYEHQIRPSRLWRWSLMSRSYFHMAEFDLALATLEKYEQLAPTETKTHGLSSLSSATIREILRSKNEGNKAYKSEKYREAVKHYSDAIKQSIESKSFTAICLCNRAAALQALGEVTDAIADCNIAIALDGDYIKAISRRAKLHEKIRDYEHAALDFQRLISLLEKKSEMKYVDELAVARRHLSSMNKNKKKGTTLDLYLILGLKGSESGSEIKKAYHKAALRHHPDKAGKFLARSESGLDGHVWNEIFATIHKDADKLFKKIGEAYAVLSDVNKRFSYNLQDHDDFGRGYD